MTDNKEKPEKLGTRTGAGLAFVMFATSIGVPFERILKKVGVESHQLMDPEGRLPQEFFLKLFRLIDKARPGKNASLELASVVPYSLTGPLGRLMVRAPDLRTMLELLLRGQDLLSDQLDVELIDSENEVMLKMHHELDELDEGLGAELGIGLSSRMGRDYYGDNFLTRVQFRHSPRAPLSVYEAFFDAPVEFETDYNGLVLGQEALKRPNRKAGVESITVLKQRLDELRRDMGVVDDDGLADVREAIMRNATRGDYTVIGLASTMAMSPRSLQRRIQQAGTSTRVLIEDTRYTYAMELLVDASTSIETVGQRLGFDSERGFRRAFERWTGKSPAQVRKELQTK
jgi:AraC-like DNA-binding protein